jgi:putative N-acetylmannosamine-6-phosphate epimerase
VACVPALVLAVGLGACSDDDSSDGGSAGSSDAEQLCDDWAQTRSAVTALADVDVVADGTEALQAAVDGVTDTLRPLREEAGEAVGDEVDALGQSVADLATEVSGLADEPADEPAGDGDGAGSGLVAVGAAVQGVTAAADALGTALAPGCDT